MRKAAKGREGGEKLCSRAERRRPWHIKASTSLTTFARARCMGERRATNGTRILGFLSASAATKAAAGSGILCMAGELCLCKASSTSSCPVGGSGVGNIPNGSARTQLYSLKKR
jgi:hypothetical protein